MVQKLGLHMRFELLKPQGLGYHTKALARLGATREEVAKVLGMAIYMSGVVHR